jgi:hypothetical protein
MVEWMIKRGKEPSTWAGFAGLAAALGVSQPLFAAVSAALVGIFSVVAVVMAEKGPAE